MALNYLRSFAPLVGDKPESQAEIEKQLQAARNYGSAIAEKPLLSDENYKNSSQTTAPSADVGAGQTVLSDEDEKFLERVASSADLPLGDGVKQDEEGATAGQEDKSNTNATAETGTDESKSRKSGWLPSMPSVSVPSMPQMPSMPNMPQMPQGYGIDSLPSLPSLRRTDAPTTNPEDASTASTKPEDPSATSPETKEQEKRNLTTLLGRLDLSVSSLNNRVISLSDPSKKLLNDFNTIIRDIVNGAPTAYDDLEKFLTQRQSQIEGLYESMPPFLQGLISSLPMRMAAGLGPQFAAAAGARFGGDGSAQAASAPSPAPPRAGNEKAKRAAPSYVPNLRSLVTQQGMVASMLRSIMSFLESRFPMLLGGTNVLMSLALFVLMFVFWYSHKRGREVRMAQESLQTDLDTANEETLKRYREAQAQAPAGGAAVTAAVDDQIAFAEGQAADVPGSKETQDMQEKVSQQGADLVGGNVEAKQAGEQVEKVGEVPKVGRVKSNPWEGQDWDWMKK